MKTRAMCAAGLLAICAWMPASAQESQGSAEEQFEASLGYQTGEIKLPGGMATINLPESFRYVNAAGTRKVLVDAWGNPPGSAQGVLGMLVPAGVSPLTEEGWGIVITFDDDGYVDDEDAAGMNFDELLTQMQEDAEETNAERQKLGFETVTLMGWAEPPHYDATSKKLYWAKELAFGGKPEHTLNYNIRILGRRGVLVLNAVSGMDQLDEIRAETETVLAAVDFNAGHRYSDYTPGTDKAAAYGIAGLIAGSAATKAGLFKALWIGLLASKKLVAVGVLALFAALKKLFTRKPATANT